MSSRSAEIDCKDFIAIERPNRCTGEVVQWLFYFTRLKQKNLYMKLRYPLGFRSVSPLLALPRKDVDYFDILLNGASDSNLSALRQPKLKLYDPHPINNWSENASCSFEGKGQLVFSDLLTYRFLSSK